MLMKITLSLLYLLNGVVSIANTMELADEEYYRLPALFEVQDSEKCLSQRENVICAGTFELTSPEPSRVYDVLKKYSSNKREHFNHTRVHRVVCLGPKYNCPVRDDLRQSFEECIDGRMSEEYGLRASLMHLDFCRRSGEKLKTDGVDIAFCSYIAVVIVLNVVGTVYDCFLKETNAKGNRWLMAFSLKDNWKRLTSRSEAQDPRLQNLSCLNGIRSLFLLLVLYAHVFVIMIWSFPVNPRFIAQIIRSPLGKYILYHPYIAIQSFIFVASFLTAYKILMFSEKYPMKLQLLPKFIIDRIVRIQPMHLTSIAAMATIVFHSNDSPLWYKYFGSEATNCRDLWWHHVFFVHNTRRWTECVPQSWYLAMEMQVYIVCCIIMLWIVSRGLDPEYVLRRLLAASLLVVFGIVYFFELRPPLLYINPENLLGLFAEESSFVYLYQSAWGNLPAAVFGLLLASTCYRLEREKVDLTMNKTFLIMNQLSLPLVLLWLVMTIYLFMDIESRLAVSLYATAEKIGFVAIVSIAIIGCFYKIKGPATAVLCWPGWMVLSRLSLGALMVHVVVNAHVTLSRIYSTMSYTQMTVDFIAVSVITHLLALPLVLLVEYPAMQLYKGIINSRSHDEKENVTNVKNK